MTKERELLRRVVENHDSPYGWELMEEIEELIAQPESLTPRQGLAEYIKGYHNGYNVAVRDLKQKVDSVFNLIMEEDDE